MATFCVSCGYSCVLFGPFNEFRSHGRLRLAVKQVGRCVRDGQELRASAQRPDFGHECPSYIRIQETMRVSFRWREAADAPRRAQPTPTHRVRFVWNTFRPLLRCARGPRPRRPTAIMSWRESRLVAYRWASLNAPAGDFFWLWPQHNLLDGIE